MDRKTLLEKGFTEEQVTEILNGFHAEKQALEDEKARLTTALDAKTREASELAGYKAKIAEIEKANMTKEEQIAQMQKEAEENLRKSRIINNKAQAKSILASVGIEDEDIINDLTTSDETKTVEAATRIANKFKTIAEETAKKTKEQLANIDITPNGSNKQPQDNNAMTWEKFDAMSAEEQDKFAEEHPEEFENL